jgi:tRNA dimethylallyltransferase
LTKTVIIIAGPTAVGKTGVAIEIAKHFSTEIISADSRQCYKELNIGVARPSEVELASVPHYFIASHSIHQTVNAGVFEQYALDKTEQVLKDKNLLVMVGGTGLYIKSFCEGIDEIPSIPETIRNEIVADYNQ